MDCWYVLYLLVSTCGVPRPLRRVDLEDVGSTYRPATYRPMLDNRQKMMHRAIWLGRGSGLYGRVTAVPEEVAVRANTGQYVEDYTTDSPTTSPPAMITTASGEGFVECFAYSSKYMFQ